MVGRGEPPYGSVIPWSRPHSPPPCSPIRPRTTGGRGRRQESAKGLPHCQSGTPTVYRLAPSLTRCFVRLAPMVSLAEPPLCPALCQRRKACMNCTTDALWVPSTSKTITKKLKNNFPIEKNFPTLMLRCGNTHFSAFFFVSATVPADAKKKLKCVYLSAQILQLKRQQASSCP